MRQVFLYLLFSIMMNSFSSNESSIDALKFLGDLTDDYDMYVFSVQWGNTLCVSEGQECESKLSKIPKNILTIHGLWPSYRNGKKIEKCNTGHDIEVKEDATDLFQKMEVYWVSFVKPNDGFWSHEYNTHGYCYTEKYKLQGFKPYFEYVLSLFQSHGLDTLLTKTFGDLHGTQSFEIHDLKNHLDQILGHLYYEFDCKHHDSNQYLQEIRFFFDLTLNPIDVKQQNECKLDSPILIEFK